MEVLFRVFGFVALNLLLLVHAQTGMAVLFFSSYISHDFTLFHIYDPQIIKYIIFPLVLVILLQSSALILSHFYLKK